MSDLDSAAAIAESMGYGAVARAILSGGDPALLDALLKKRARTLECASRVQATILAGIVAERDRQDTLFPDESPIDGTPFPFAEEAAAVLKMMGQKVKITGKECWARILLEEVAEALVEGDRSALRRELLQVAAVAVNWIERIDKEAK